MKHCPLCGAVMEDSVNICHYCEGNVLTSFKSYLAALEPEEIDVISKALGGVGLTSFFLTSADVLDFAEAMKPAEFFRELRSAIKNKWPLEDVLSVWKDKYSKEIAEWLK